MKASHLNIGILHSLIGKNDGVSIVIDQTVNAMVKDMDIDLGHIHFLAAHTSPRFNAVTDEIFWHKSEVHKNIIANFSANPAPKGLVSLLFSHWPLGLKSLSALTPILILNETVTFLQVHGV